MGKRKQRTHSFSIKIFIYFIVEDIQNDYDLLPYIFEYDK